jgi:hypothetical protein
MPPRRRGQRPALRDPDRSAEYHRRHPEPNYSQFGRLGVEYYDKSGREYVLAKPGTPIRKLYEEHGEIRSTRFAGPVRRRGRPQRVRVGTQLFWVRLPKRIGPRAAPPDPDGERLVLYFAPDQIVCTGRTHGVFFGRRKRTGYMLLSEMAVEGSVADPREFEGWTTLRAREA